MFKKVNRLDDNVNKKNINNIRGIIMFLKHMIKTIKTSLVIIVTHNKTLMIIYNNQQHHHHKDYQTLEYQLVKIE